MHKVNDSLIRSTNKRSQRSWLIKREVGKALIEGICLQNKTGQGHITTKTKDSKSSEVSIPQNTSQSIVTVLLTLRLEVQE